MLSAPGDFPSKSIDRVDVVAANARAAIAQAEGRERTVGLDPIAVRVERIKPAWSIAQ